MPLLDGKHVEATEIDPAKHRCIGTWRPPAVPERFVISDFDLASKPYEEIRKLGETECPCGYSLNYPSHHPCVSLGKPFKHWQDGCFDEPQYVSMETGEEKPDKSEHHWTDNRNWIEGFEAGRKCHPTVWAWWPWQGDPVVPPPPDEPPEPDAAPPPARPLRRDEVGPFNPNASHPKKMERPDPLTEEMERSRLAWARARAKDLGIALDDPQIRTLGIVPWEAAFRAGMKYAKTLRDKRPWDYWWWKCATCGRTALQSPEAGKKPSRCYGCRKPDWKLMKHQESFLAGAADWTHPAGEI